MYAELGNGDGTFLTPLGQAGGGYSVAVGDFNQDGRPDVVVAGLESLTVLLGNGDGSFAPAVTYATNAFPVSVAVADFNGDGKPDIAFASAGLNGLRGTLGVLLNKGDGTFISPVTYSVNGGAQSVVVGDFNGDGVNDLAVVGSVNGTVSVLQGNGDGSFQSPVNYSAGNMPWALAVGDFNGDGRTDIAVVNKGGGVSLLLASAPGSAASETPSVTAVVNSANLMPGLAPGTWVTIFGSNLSSTMQLASFNGASLPTSFAGISVTVGGLPAWMSYVSPSQINVLVPGISGPIYGTTTSVQVMNAAGSSNVFSVPARNVSPAFFELSADNGRYAARRTQRHTPFSVLPGYSEREFILNPRRRANS